MDDTNPYGTTPEQPNSRTSFFLNTDAQAILEESPDLETGLELLNEAYKASTWSDPKEAASIVSDYAQQLRYRFNDSMKLNDNEIQIAAPIDLNEIQGEDNDVVGKINIWEQKNKEYLDTNTADTDRLLIKEKLKSNISEYASSLRQGALGKDDNWLQDKFYRFGTGLSGGILKAVGAHDTLQALQERTDPDRDRDFSSDLASGAGAFAGAVGGGAAGFAVGGPVGSTVVAGSYLAGTAIGEIKDTYNRSLAETGDQNRATTAAAIESGSQAIMTGLGGKIFAKTGQTLAKSIFGKEVGAVVGSNTSHILKKSAELGVIGGAANTLSNVAEQYGTNQKIEPFVNIERAVAVQAIFGAASGGLDLLARKRNLGLAQPAPKSEVPELGTPGDPPPAEVSVTGGVREQSPEAGAKAISAINVDQVTLDTNTTKARLDPEGRGDYDFVTGDGSRYTLTKEGASAKEDIASGETYQPFDRTFFVKPEIAAKIAGLKDGTDASGEPVRLLTDLNGLYLKSSHIDENLNLTESPTGSRLVEVPTEKSASVGLVPVQVNRPRNTNGHSRTYRSEIGQPISSLNPTKIDSAQSVGAAFSPTRESALGERLRRGSNVQSDVQQLFGTGTGAEDYGFLRYVPKSHAESTDTADKFFAEHGELAAIDHIINSPSNVVDSETIALGRKLIFKFNDAAKAAEVAGDTKAVADMGVLLDKVAFALSKKNTNAGQAIEINKMFNQLDPEFHVAKVRQELTRAAIDEAANELKISPEEITRTDTEINNIDEQVKGAQAVIDAESQHLTKQFDPELQETGKIIADIDKTAEDAHQKFLEQENTAVAELEGKAKTIEEEATKKTETKTKDIEQGVEAAKKQVETLDKKAETHVEEAKAIKEKLKKGIAEAEDKLKNIEAKGDKPTSQNKKLLTSLKHSIESDKSKLEKLKTLTKENALSAAEKNKLNELNRLIKSAQEKKAKLKSEELSPSDKAKIDKLRGLARERKENVTKALREDFLSKRQVKDREALVKKREELKNKKAEAQKNGAGAKSALAEMQRKRIQELTAKKKSLVDRKKVIDKKVVDKFGKDAGEKIQKMKNLLAAAKAAKGSTQQKLLTEAYKIKDDLLKTAPKANDALYGLFQANLLSDPSTQAVNIIGNASQVLASTLSYAITGLPRGNVDAGVFLSGILKGMSGEGFEAFVSEMQGVKTFKPEIGKFHDEKPNLSRPNEGHQDFIKTAPTWMRKLGLHNMGYVFRALSAADATFYRGLKEGQARVIAYNEGKKLGVKDLRTYVAEKLFNSTEAWEGAHRQATSEAATLKEHGIETSPRETDLRAWEILDEQRSPSLREESHRFAKRSTFTNTPDGKIGAIINAFTKFVGTPVTIAGKEIRPFRYLLPFMNTAGNILNSNLDLTPIGLIRSIEKFNPKKTGLERRNALGKFMLGAMGTGIVYGIAREFMDDKDPKFAIYGAGPRSPALRRQLEAQGWRPYSVKWGDSYIRYPETPLGIMFGFLGSWMDQQRYSPAYERKQGTAAVAMVVSGGAKSFIDNSFLKNVSDLIGTFKGDPGKDPRNLIANVSRGFIPASGTLRAVTKLFQDPIETYDDMWSKFVSGIPAVQSLGTKSALNVFGEPVERTFEDRLSFIGRFYSKRVTDPTWRWLAETGYNVPEQSGFTVELSEKYNENATKQRSQKLGAAYAGVLTPSEAREFVAKSGPRIKAIVDRYRQRYGQSGYREEIQKEMDSEISEARSEVKQDMFLR